MFRKLFEFFKELFNLSRDTDIRGTIDSIRNSITLQGNNVWILACGAILASIGLDMNSEAVIIGAMLISPLMSPILGIGLSIGINDRDTLLKALNNFGIAVTASLLMSFLYFLITPIGEVNEMILARTKPTILDVGVAIFGGVAGIVAGSRKDKTNAIPGVAIATALMPPLCVAGYGLAKANLEIFAGAFYLFFLNAVFIALSTYVIVRYLKFPYVEFVDRQRQRRVQIFILAFVLILVIPSGFILANLIKGLRLRQQVDRFVTEQIEGLGCEEMEHQYVQGDSISFLKVVITGKYLEDAQVARLDSMLEVYGIFNTHLRLLQISNEFLEKEQFKGEVKSEVISALQTQQAVVDERDARIRELESTINNMNADSLPLGRLGKELNALYPELKRIAFSKAVEIDFKDKPDTISMALVEWNSSLRSSERRKNEQRIALFLQERLELDTLRIMEMR